MVPWAWGYYGSRFKGFQGVTQGYPLSPTIFNVVVDAMIQHWLVVVAEADARANGLGRVV